MFEHISGILLVTVALAAGLAVYNNKAGEEATVVDPAVKRYLDLPFVDYDDPFQNALLAEIIEIYYPERLEENAAVIDKIEQYRVEQLKKSLKSAGHSQRLTRQTLFRLFGMYGKFLVVYVLVMLMTYYAVQTLGLWRFVGRKRRAWEKQGKRFSPMRIILSTAGAILKGVFTFILFSPSYVIAYSIRTEFSTDSTVFLVLLGVVSNGLVILYANKFYTFLVSESRKGYVETALVKNLDASWANISRKDLLRPVKRFDGHVLGHIYRNARFQYLGTIKEQASFLITGLMIIEMALNIHGHLSYELLRQILYSNVNIVAVIFLGIFYLVKLTEIVTDLLIHREAARYENR